MMTTAMFNTRTTRRKARESSRTIPGSRAVLGSRVLAQRNPAAAAVGAWVEGGTELREHPSVLASRTEQLQEENRRRNEENIQQCQENVRIRLVRHVRLAHTQRLMAADHMWNGQQDIVSPAPQSCPLIQHKVSGQVFSHIDKSPSDVGTSRVLWPLNNTEEQKRQRQSQFLEQRRLFMNKEREHVKENQEYKRHILKTASLKSEKERARLEEERRLKEARVLYAAQQTLEQREQQVQEQLRQEAAAAGQGHRDRKHSHRPKTLTRQINTLKAQLRELLSGPASEVPPLCCCASFWESHPDTCANNCVFHNNLKAYIQALQAVVHSWDLH